MAPRFDCECPLGPRKRNPDIHSLFLSKLPVNKPAPSSPTGPLWRELPVYRALFTSLKFLVKIPLNIEMFPFSQRPQERSVTPYSPKAGHLWKQTPIPEPYLMYLSGSGVKEPSLQAPLMKPRGERCPVK
jgi:hypothetical protein